jgi:hypothetical protein
MAYLRSLVYFAALLLFCSSLPAQDVPAGWKVVKDKQGVCQIAVPANWEADKLLSSFVSSPDGNANAVPHGLRAGQTFPAATAGAKQVMVPTKIIEDSAKRLWYAYSGTAPSSWYVAVPGSTVCTAQIAFKAPAMEETAKKIALSLTQAK